VAAAELVAVAFAEVAFAENEALWLARLLLEIA
jgi:hypothetical protein